jgi:hypothetical protein
VNAAETKPVRQPAPAWVAPAFAAFAIVMVPWIAYLAVTLPRATRTYERGPWVGYDIALMLVLAVTAILAWRGSSRVAFATAVTATLLVVDAWFDVTTSIGHAAFTSALAMSVVEIGLAAVCVWIAYHADRVVRTSIRDLLRRTRRRAPDAAPSTTMTTETNR